MKKNTRGPSRKEEEIARLLFEGVSPAELVHRGFSKGTTYKIAKRLKPTTTPQPTAIPATSATNSPVDPNLEGDPEIMDLKKTLRKAQLQRQLAEIKAPIDLQARLKGLEEEMKALSDALADLYGQLEDSPVSGLRQEFRCACGARGLVAAKVVCTSCLRESSYGWWPRKGK